MNKNLIISRLYSSNINTNNNQQYNKSNQTDYAFFNPQTQSTPSQFSYQHSDHSNFTFQKRSNIAKDFFDHFDDQCKIIYSKVKLQNQKKLQRKLEYQLLYVKTEQNNYLKRDQINVYKKQSSNLNFHNKNKTKELRHNGISLVQLKKQPSAKAYLYRNQSQIEFQYYNQNVDPIQKCNKNSILFIKNRQDNYNKNSQNCSDSFIGQQRRNNCYQSIKSKQLRDIKNEDINNGRYKNYLVRNDSNENNFKISKLNAMKTLQQIQDMKIINRNEIYPTFPSSSTMGLPSSSTIGLPSSSTVALINNSKYLPYYQRFQTQESRYSSNSYQLSNKNSKAPSNQHNNQFIEQNKYSKCSRLDYYRKQRQLKLAKYKILTQTTEKQPHFQTIQPKNYHLQRQQRYQNAVNSRQQSKQSHKLTNQFSERLLLNYQKQNNAKYIKFQRQKQNYLKQLKNNKNSRQRSSKVVQYRDKQSQKLKSIRQQLHNMYQINKQPYSRPKLVIQKRSGQQEKTTLKKVGQIVRF